MNGCHNCKHCVEAMGRLWCCHPERIRPGCVTLVPKEQTCEKWVSV